MGLRGVLGRIDRAVGRFNRWLGPAAIADGTLQGPTPQHADPTHVAAILGELERHPRDADRDDSPER